MIIKLKYLIPLLIAVICIFADMMINASKKRRVKSSLIQKLERLSKASFIKILYVKPESKDYKKIKTRLKQAGLTITPEVYQVITYIVPFIIVFFLLTIKYTNVINTLINIEKIKMVAEDLGKPELAQVNLKVNLIHVLLVMYVGHKLPDLFLKILIGFRNAITYKEVLMLQTYTLIMLKAGKNVKQILICLKDRSKAYKKYLEVAVNSYSANPSLALEELKDSVGNKDFTKICIALEQTLNNDKQISLKYLQNHRVFGKELAKQQRRKKNIKKKIVGILMMIIPLIVFAAVGGFPWLVYTLKQMDSVPI